jgi:hypothetical protein
MFIISSFKKQNQHIMTHKVKYIVYRHFPEKRRLCTVVVIIQAGSSYTWVNTVDVYTLHVTRSRTKFEELNMGKSWTGNAFLTLSDYLKKPLLLLLLLLFLHHHRHRRHYHLHHCCYACTMNVQTPQYFNLDITLNMIQLQIKLSCSF